MLLVCHVHANLCRSYPCPRSMAMIQIAFLHFSIFCTSFASTWCSFRSLYNLSMYRRLGLREGSSFQHSLLLFSYLHYSNHQIGLPCNAALYDIYGDWLDHCSSPEHFVSDSVIPDFVLNPSSNPHIGDLHLLAFCSL